MVVILLLLLSLTLGKFAAAATEEASTTDKSGPTKAVESTHQSTSGIEDLFKDSPSILEKPQKDAKTDIMSLFEKVYILASLMCI